MSGKVGMERDRIQCESRDRMTYRNKVNKDGRWNDAGDCNVRSYEERMGKGHQWTSTGNLGGRHHSSL